MRLAKLASQKTKKNNQLKYEMQQQQYKEWDIAKGQTGGGGGGVGGGIGKRFSGTFSILSISNNSGSARSIGAGGNCAPRNSFGNGSCISSSASATNNTCSNKKRKSKATKCFSSTVFRCCLPCRGGSGSAAPATSPPPLTPTPRPSNSYSATADSTVTRKRSGQSAFHLTTDGNESLIATVKKHSLADTIGTSATTPISLKTLINDEEEDLQQHISAADIAAAKLASGILPRKAEPETLSDASISPTTAVLHLAANSTSASSLLSTTTSLLSTTAANTQVTLVANNTTTTQISPITPPNTKSNFISQSPKTDKDSIVTAAIQSTASPLQPLVTSVASTPSGVTSAVAPINANTAAATTATTTSSSTASSSTPSRCCCPPPQTSPLPHIKEEEESEQLLQRQYSASHDDDTLTEPTSERQIAHQYQQQQQQQSSQFDQLSPFTANPSGSSDSCTSLSATAVTTATTSSITGGGYTPQEFTTTTSTPSPRIKHKFRKQHKSGWSRLILAPSSGIVTIGGGSCGVVNSSETLATSSNNSSSAATASAALTAAQTRLTSASAIALATQQSSSSQLLPATKMQAEQGSIGDLQKYHSRYLKNRRHTLANVR